MHKHKGKYGGAEATVTITGGSSDVGYCNTINKGDGKYADIDEDETDQAGTLFAVLTHFKPGLYDVSLTLILQLRQEKGGPGNCVRSSAVLQVGTAANTWKTTGGMVRNGNPVDHYYTTPDDWSVVDRLKFSITVRVNDDGYGRVAHISPDIAGHIGKGTYSAQIWVDDIKPAPAAAGK